MYYQTVYHTCVAHLIFAQVTSLKLKLNTWPINKMAYWMTIISALHFAICPITCAIHNFTSTDDADFPQVNVTSLQSNSSNCLITRYDNGRTTVIQSKEHSTCSFQLLASYNVTTTLEVVSKSSFFLHVELKEQRFLLLTGQNNTCSVFFCISNILLSLQGHVELVISTRSFSYVNSSNICHQSGSGYDSDTTSCSIDEYYDTITCSSEVGFEYLGHKWFNYIKMIEVCSVKFQSNCDSFLGFREYKQDCDAVIVNRVLIFYPTNIKVLGLIGNNIAQVSVPAFRGLHKLTGLLLSKNKIEILQNNLFQDLLRLLYLDLSRNRIVSISPAVFNGLGKLMFLSISNNRLTYLDESLFKGLSNVTDLYLKYNYLKSVTSELLNLPQLTFLDLSRNPLNLTQEVPVFSNLNKLWFLSLKNTTIKELPINVFTGLHSLEHLLIDDNDLKDVSAEYFHDLKNMKSLHLRKCQLTNLDGYIFRYLTRLEFLSVGQNNFSLLKSRVFSGLNNLLLLRVPSSRLKYIEFDVFKATPNVIFIDLSSNELTELPDMHFLLSMVFLNLKGNQLTKITKESFAEVMGSTDIYVSQHEICVCFVPTNYNCSATEQRSPYLTCDRLLSNTSLAVIMWVIGINALLGNLFVLIFKSNSSSGVIKVQGLFLSNLALSDFLMGIYMMVIASADIYFGEFFPMYAEQWRSGVICRVTGAIAIISSEASVFFVTLISFDRFINIRFPFFQFKFKRQSAVITILSAWVIAFILGVIPSVLAGRNFKFYDNSHVCVGLPLALRQIFESRETDGIRYIGKYGFQQNTFKTIARGYSNGKYFSTAVFLGLNCVCYLIIVCCYIEILRSVRKSSKRAGRTHEMRKHIKMTMRVAAIVATDFFCWSPIIGLGILVQTRVIILSPAAFAWFVSFVLPINSAINPYLYTIADAVAKYRKSKSEVRVFLSIPDIQEGKNPDSFKAKVERLKVAEKNKQTPNIQTNKQTNKNEKQT